MKRRGMQPNLRTYTTMFTGYCTITNWKAHTVQLGNAHKLYASLVELIDTLSKIDPNHEELSISPLNAYLTILHKAHQFDKIFDTYYAMKDEGPTAPDHVTYSIIFNALRLKGELQGPEEPSVHRQNASDARVFWRQLIRASQKVNGLVIDSYIIAPIIQILYRGSPSDQLLAFDIIREYLGLSKPGDEQVKGKLRLDSRLFFVALDACVRTQKHRLAIHWMQQMMTKPLEEGEKTIIQHSHIEQMLLAYGSLAGMGSMNESQQALAAVEWAIRNSITQELPKLQPSQKMYQLALGTCWRCTDWDAALRLFELMTGFDAKDFADGATIATERPVRHERSEGYNLVPQTPIFCTLARTAIATGDKANMRQCLRIISRFGGAHIFEKGTGREHVDFYASKTAEAIVRLVWETVKPGVIIPEITPEEYKRWRALRVRAWEVVNENRAKPWNEVKNEDLPPLEDSLLGSSRLLDQTEAEVNLSLDARTSAPNKRLQ